MTSDRIDVLDHGYIRIVDSMPREPGAGDLSIVRAARTSYDAAWRAGADEGPDARLIRYLMAHDHMGPFEHVSFSFEIQLPFIVARQWHRYRVGWSYSEVSARYSEMPDLFYVPAADRICAQSATNKQGSGDRLPRDIAVKWHNGFKDFCDSAFTLYHEMLLDGMARELARGVLPGFTYTRMATTTNLRALFHFLEQRLDPHAQYEIRVYAQAIETLIEPIVPVAFAAWKEGRKGNG